MVKVNTAVVALAVSVSAGSAVASRSSVFAREPEPFSLDEIKDAGKSTVSFFKGVFQKKVSTAAPVPIEIPEADETAATDSTLAAREPFSFEDAVNKAKQLGTEGKAIFKSVFSHPAAAAPEDDTAVIDPAALQAREAEPLSFDEVITEGKQIVTDVEKVGTDIKTAINSFRGQGANPVVASPVVSDPASPVDTTADPTLQAREPEPFSFTDTLTEGKQILTDVEQLGTDVKTAISSFKGQGAAAPAAAPADPAADPAADPTLQAREPEPFSLTDTIAEGEQILTDVKQVGTDVKTAISSFKGQGAAAPVAAPADPAADPTADPTLQAREPFSLSDTLAEGEQIFTDVKQVGTDIKTAISSFKGQGAVAAPAAAAPADPAAADPTLQTREPFSFDDFVNDIKNIGSEVKTAFGGLITKGEAAVAPAVDAVEDAAAAVPAVRRSFGMLKVRRYVADELD